MASEDVDGGYKGWTIDKAKAKGVRCMEFDTITGHFATTSAMPNITGKCPHGRQRYYCKDCGGQGICEHGPSALLTCKECGEGSICNICICCICTIVSSTDVVRSKVENKRF